MDAAWKIINLCLPQVSECAGEEAGRSWLTCLWGKQYWECDRARINKSLACSCLPLSAGSTSHLCVHQNIRRHCQECSSRYMHLLAPTALEITQRSPASLEEVQQPLAAKHMLYKWIQWHLNAIVSDVQFTATSIFSSVNEIHHFSVLVLTNPQECIFFRGFRDKDTIHYATWHLYSLAR